MRTSFVVALSSAVLFAAAGRAHAAGSVFLTGHDPDFHAIQGTNAPGAIHINNAAVHFILDPAFNPFVTAGAHKFLFVTSRIAPPSGHTDGVNGIVASGYVQGTDFDVANAAGLPAALAQLGTVYGGIVVASDFGGILTQAELNGLNSNSAAIFNFVNSGGGIYAMAEGNNGTGLTPNGGWFNFVPRATSAVNLNQSETGFTVTPFGVGLGLTNADINGNASHNIFTAWDPALHPVDMDSTGHVLSLAGRLIIPAPGGAAVLALAGIAAARRRR